MSDMESYSYVYVIVNESGSPTMVVQTEREAIEKLKTIEPQWFDYHEVPFKHHN